MKTFRWTVAVLAVFSVFCVGCNRPEGSKDELGTIVTEFPELPQRGDDLALPEGADADCPVKSQRERFKQMREATEKANASPKENAAETQEVPSKAE